MAYMNDDLNKIDCIMIILNKIYFFFLNTSVSLFKISYTISYCQIHIKRSNFKICSMKEKNSILGL